MFLPLTLVRGKVTGGSPTTSRVELLGCLYQLLPSTTMVPWTWEEPPSSQSSQGFAQWGTLHSRIIAGLPISYLCVNQYHPVCKAAFLRMAGQDWTGDPMRAIPLFPLIPDSTPSPHGLSLPCPTLTCGQVSAAFSATVPRSGSAPGLCQTSFQDFGF